MTPSTATDNHLVRCCCHRCGAHSNADVGLRWAHSCPNCGSYDHDLLEGAAPLLGLGADGLR